MPVPVFVSVSVALAVSVSVSVSVPVSVSVVVFVSLHVSVEFVRCYCNTRSRSDPRACLQRELQRGAQIARKQPSSRYNRLPTNSVKNAKTLGGSDGGMFGGTAGLANEFVDEQHAFNPM